VKKRTLFSSLLFIFLVVLPFGDAYAAPKKSREQPKLININFIDQHGVSETINNPERLKQYEKIDFLSTQPYKKIMRVYTRDDQGLIHAIINSYHPSGLPKQYLEVINGRAYGYYREWFTNGCLKVEAYVINGEADLNPESQVTWLFDGLSRAWDEKGNLIAEIPYENGEFEGIAVYYHPNGNLWKKVPLHKNLIKGTCEFYLENGDLFQTVHFSNGEKEGPSRRYWPDGSFAANETYCEGNLVDGEYYNREGNLISRIECGKGFRPLFGKDNIIELQEYFGGVQDGLVKVFNKDGKVSKIYHIKNGMKHGEEIDYYNNSSKPKISINWSEDKIQGLVKTWYASGILESQKEMAANTKNGILTAWYNDGSLMLIEEYDHDKLLKGEYYKKGDKFPVSFIMEGKGIAHFYDQDGIFLRKVAYRYGRPEE